MIQIELNPVSIYLHRAPPTAQKLESKAQTAQGPKPTESQPEIGLRNSAAIRFATRLARPRKAPLTT
jgi:hypothetical protein